MSGQLTKYAFIDRDGTLIHEPTPQEIKPGDVPYQIDSLGKLKILPGVIDGLQKLVAAGYRLVMISNQDGLGAEIFPRPSFDSPQNKLLEICEDSGIIFEMILICPHLPVDDCNCRKPKTGLVDNLPMMENIDRVNSVVIGNSHTDKKFAKKLGLKFVEIKTNTTFKVIL
ncbi:MAG: histidinol-phosphatase [Candidatus Magasanikbacteria bacterium RIFOXYC2_FULL_42_28]|uniref:D,D-heptose 1,7-bisphosphate phosphatase n=1 Tax=Candidatus Magasanikbacteria bacterium RIFOXYC2_FULL_42_28 TaxID=1798704 RepID=A0A1F6NVV7_9BACT|nr:MAG: histidinol-phosphatase [Candidatus Magasanikbacteria bacterium RIFOXYC2_FULL_42_28]